MAETEGTRFWLSILSANGPSGASWDQEGAVLWARTELQNRGVQGVFVTLMRAMHDVHLVRHSLNFVSWKERKAEWALEIFAGKWDRKYPMISQTRRRNWCIPARASVL